jgi:2-C-methyl-D-erythritol 4-phosphate cytidylyltransferase
MMQVAALVLAAGRGERLRAGIPKAFVSLAGETLLSRALRALAAAPEIGLLIPVLAGEDAARFDGESVRLGPGSRLAKPVEGGRERQDSVRAGLAALPAGFELVAVHDAARALVRSADVSRVCQAAGRSGAALLATPASDTWKRVADGVVQETLPRDACWIAQTPQVFRVEILREALAKADAEGFVGTDDAQLVERLGVPVEIVEGPPSNRKITTPDDLAWAEAWLLRGGWEAAR